MSMKMWRLLIQQRSKPYFIVCSELNCYVVNTLSIILHYFVNYSFDFAANCQMLGYVTFPKILFNYFFLF